MSALSLLQALIKEIQALPVVADDPSFRPQSSDVAWGPIVPQGHTAFSWGNEPSQSKTFTLRAPQEMAARVAQAAEETKGKPAEKQEHAGKSDEKAQGGKQEGGKGQQQQGGKGQQQGGKGQQQQGGKGQQQQQQEGKGQQQQQGGKGQQQQQGGKGQQQQGGKGQQQGGKGQQQGGKGQQQQGQEQKEQLTPRDAFYKIDIRVGKITKAWNHPKADRLYVETIDVGEPEPRQVLSGLRQDIPLDQFEGSSCLVIVNLQPAEMKGLKSFGMVLASRTADKKVQLVKPPEGAKVGARVFLHGDEDVQWPEATELVDARKKGSAWQVIAPLLKTNAEGVVALGDISLATAGGILKGFPNATVS